MPQVTVEQLTHAETVLMQQRAILQKIWEEENTGFNSRPNQWQDSPEGQEAAKALDELSSIVSNLESTVTAFDFILKRREGRERAR